MPIRAPRRDDAGFTLTEVIVSAVVTTALSLGVTAVVLGAIDLVGQAQVTATSTAVTQDTLVEFETLVRDTERLLVANPTMLMFVHRNGANCEGHTYAVVLDDDGNPTLQHSVTPLATSGDARCSDITPDAFGTGLNADTVSTELGPLGAKTRFSYTALTGAEAILPGSDRFTPQTATPMCEVGSVTLTVETPRRNSPNRLEHATAAIRVNTMGASPC